MGSSFFTDMSSHAPGGGAGSKCRTLKFLPYFDFVAAGGIRVSQTDMLPKEHKVTSTCTTPRSLPFFCPSPQSLVGWFLRIYVDLAIFQPYLDLEAGDNQSLKIQVARPGIEPRSSCSASQELNHSATAAPILSRPMCQKSVRHKTPQFTNAIYILH